MLLAIRHKKIRAPDRILKDIITEAIRNTRPSPGWRGMGTRYRRSHRAQRRTGGGSRPSPRRDVNISRAIASLPCRPVLGHGAWGRAGPCNLQKRLLLPHRRCRPEAGPSASQETTQPRGLTDSQTTGPCPRTSHAGPPGPRRLPRPLSARSGGLARLGPCSARRKDKTRFPQAPGPGAGRPGCAVRRSRGLGPGQPGDLLMKVPPDAGLCSLRCPPPSACPANGITRHPGSPAQRHKPSKAGK